MIRSGDRRISELEATSGADDEDIRQPRPRRASLSWAGVADDLIGDPFRRVAGNGLAGLDDLLRRRRQRKREQRKQERLNESRHVAPVALLHTPPTIRR